VNRQTERIYLDYAATTPLRPESARAMRAAYETGGYNPSSLHAEGRRARALLDEARERTASALGAARREIVFTSGGTEADNLALYGVVRALGRRGRIVTAATEHHAVLHPLEQLAREGFEIAILPVDPQGRVDPGAFAAALHGDTLLATIMYANNEVGTVAPVAELAAIARRQGVAFHTDAVQAPGRLPLDVRALGVDLMSISAHKFYGPAGAGALFVRSGTPFAGLLFGGGQESGRRPGTENLAGIAGLAVALEAAVAEREDESRRVGALRDRLEAGLLSALAGVWVNGATADRLPNVANLSFAGVEAQALLARLDLEGVAVSAGSACTSGVLEGSHVIAALGAREREGAALRFSLGRPTTPAEIGRVLEIVPPVVEALRRPTRIPA
jgi:cysteine desulfurase